MVGGGRRSLRVELEWAVGVRVGSGRRGRWLAREMAVGVEAGRRRRRWRLAQEMAIDTEVSGCLVMSMPMRIPCLEVIPSNVQLSTVIRSLM